MAFDLGAESGRAVLGRLRAGRLELQEIHRFPNGPVQVESSLQWDVLCIVVSHGLVRSSNGNISI
jgi:rhamnulokinase